MRAGRHRHLRIGGAASRGIHLARLRRRRRDEKHPATQPVFTDLALAREEIKRLRVDNDKRIDNDKLRRTAQRLLGRLD